MADFDVSLRLRLINQLTKPARDAARNLDGIAAAAGRLGGKGGGSAAGGLALSAKAAQDAARAFQSTAKIAKVSFAQGAMGAEAWARAMTKMKTEAAGAAAAADKAATAAKKIRTPPPRLTLPTPSLAPARRTGGPKRDSAGRLRDGNGRFLQEGGSIGGTAQGALAAGAAARMAGVDPGVLRQAAGAAGGAYALKQMTGAALSLERVLYDVQKATDASGAELEQYKRFLQDTARASGKTAEELGGMLAQAGYAGRPKGDLQRFTRFAAMATGAWGTSAEETGQALAEIGNIYQARQARIEEIADAINTMADVSASKETDLLDFLRRAGGQAKAQGISAEQTLAFGAALKEVGVRTDVAATGFSAFINALTMGEDAEDKAVEALKTLGFNAKKLTKDFSKKPVETMMALLRKIDGVGDGVKRNKILLDIFGKEYADDIGRMAGGTGRLGELLGVAGDRMKYLGSVAKSFDLLKDKDFHKLDQATQAINTLIERMGNPLKIAAGSMAEDINKVAERLETSASLWEQILEKQRAYNEAKYGAGQTEGERQIRADEAEHAKLQKETGEWIGRVLLGNPNETRTAGQIIQEWMFGRTGKRKEDLKAAGDAGRAKAAGEKLAQEKAIHDRIAQVRAKIADMEASGSTTRGTKFSIERGRVLLQQLEDMAREYEREWDRLFARLDEKKDVDRRIGQTHRFAPVARLDANVNHWPEYSDNNRPPVAGVAPGLTMFPLSKATTGPKSAPALKAAAAEASKLSIALGEADAKRETLTTALGASLAPAAQQAVEGFNAALKAGLDRAQQIAREAASSLSGILSFNAAPTIAPRVAPAPSPGPKKAAARGDGGGISVGVAHFHGVQDVAGLKRELVAEVDRRQRGARGGALHDLA